MFPSKVNGKKIGVAMELSTVHVLLLLFVGVAIMCYSAQYTTLLRPTGSD